MIGRKREGMRKGMRKGKREGKVGREKEESEQGEGRKNAKQSFGVQCTF